MRSTTLLAAIAATLFVVSCSDQPTTPSRLRGSTTPELKRDGHGPKSRGALLTNVPESGALSDGGTFVGTLTVTHIAVDQATRAMTITGMLNGTATNAAGVATAITDLVINTPATLSRASSVATGPSAIVHQASMATCDILFLDLGPLHLDLLGLTLDLSEIILDLNAVSGAGNLLGNLLCALTGLLDLPGILADISHILDAVNGILGGLSGLGVGGASWIAPAVPGLGTPILRT